MAMQKGEEGDKPGIGDLTASVECDGLDRVRGRVLEPHGGGHEEEGERSRATQHGSTCEPCFKRCWSFPHRTPPQVRRLCTSRTRRRQARLASRDRPRRSRRHAFSPRCGPALLLPADERTCTAASTASTNAVRRTARLPPLSRPRARLTPTRPPTPRPVEWVRPALPLACQ